MQIHQLPQLTERKAKIVGRGQGSGKGGHTTGRGTKGQKARERVVIWFDGTKSGKSLIGRLPFLRGKGKFKPWGANYEAVNIKKLADWPEKKEVTNDALVEAGIIRPGNKAKVVGKSDKKLNLVFKVPTSKSVAEVVKQ